MKQIPPIVALITSMSWASNAAAQQVWEPWIDLINFEAAASGLISARTKRGHTEKSFEIQRIPKGTGEALNVDEYSVSISRLPNNWTPEQFFSHVRVNLNNYLDQNVAILSAYTSGDKTDWAKNTNPSLGILMEFEIETPAINDVAGVVVSRTSDLSWVFSPITDGVSDVTSDFGTHPVAGNRQFGLRKKDAGYEFFIRAADRVYPHHVDVFEDDAFKGADALWRSFQTKLVTYVNANGGTAKAMTPTVPGGNSAAKKPQWATVCKDSKINIGC